MMFVLPSPLRWLALIALSMLGAAHTSDAAPIKGGNWLRVDHNYAYNGSTPIPPTDPRRVGWNLEIAKDIPNMVGWPHDFRTLYDQYSIQTLIRLGWGDAKPNAQEIDALNSANFSCGQIGTLLQRLRDEANAIAPHAAIAGFILANEPNLDWGVEGAADGRVHKCFRASWSGSSHGNKRLLVAGPGGCSGTENLAICSIFYSQMLTELGSTIDGFAIHAYGVSGAAVRTDFLWQMNLINGSANAAAIGKPTYITEFNTGASKNAPLPPAQPNPSAYFNDVLTGVRDYNNVRSQQLKAVMYFVDSPDAWTRLGQQCHPNVPTPPTHEWWQASLCALGERRTAWLNSQPMIRPLDASLSIGGIPSFVMPGQILSAGVKATNTGSTTWLGGGQSSWFRLGANSTANRFTFNFHPSRGCGGYSNSVIDARVYTCSNVAPNGIHTYQFDLRAPTSGTSAVFSARMVQDGVAWFGNIGTKSVAMGQPGCGTALTQCILNARQEILPYYGQYGWNTACWNRDNIVADWCSHDAAGCNALKSTTCATFNSSCRCAAGIHLGGVAIDPNTTYCGYQVCGTDRRVYSCGSNNLWSNTGLTCN